MFGPIYAITDPVLLPGERLFSAVDEALSGGIKIIQLRDKSCSPEKLFKMAKRLVKQCNEHNAYLIVNDHPEIAKLCGAHGVHLGQGDGDVVTARQSLGSQAIIGVTCHNNLSLAHKAQSDGASYVAFGRFYPSETKAIARPASPQILQHAKAELKVPLVAIGGITLDNMAPLVQAGADCLAVCHALFSTANIAEQATRLINQFHSRQTQ